MRALPDPDDILEFLRGTWTIARRIPGIAKLTGKAVFSSTGAAKLHYEEVGTLFLKDGHIAKAQREYIFSAAPSGFDVYFKETPARLFHEARFEPLGLELVAHCDHLCLADQYRSRYRLRNHDSFSLQHRISGPRKDYSIVTVYKRLSSGVIKS